MPRTRAQAIRAKVVQCAKVARDKSRERDDDNDFEEFRDLTIVFIRSTICGERTLHYIYIYIYTIKF